jgi:Zn finger protein HypA/HybF involved in hydrogenase expression
MLDSERVSQEIVAEAIMIWCPKCKNDFDVEEAELDEGDILSCMECGGSQSRSSGTEEGQR